LSIVYAGTRPDQFNGAINFVGGWMTDKCPDPAAINTVAFKRGARFDKPTLWLYGENDPYYQISHSRQNFDAFVRAGGKGTFITYSLGSRDGHSLLNSPDTWRDAVASFVEQVKQRDRP